MVIIRLWIESGFEFGLLIRIHEGQEKKQYGFKKARKKEKQSGSKKAREKNNLNSRRPGKKKNNPDSRRPGKNKNNPDSGKAREKTIWIQEGQEKQKQCSKS